MRVRRLERADLPALAEAWGDLVAHGHGVDPRFGPATGRDGLLREHLFHALFAVRHPFPPAWVAAEGPHLVGFVHGFPLTALPVLHHPPTARIADLWIRADRRRRGLGAALVSSFVEAARQAGYARVEVGTLARDEAAVAFWRSQGFSDWRVELLREAPLYSGATQGSSPATSIRQGSMSTTRSEKK